MAKKKKKHIPNPDGRPKGSFVNTAKKEETKVMRIPVSKVEHVKQIIKAS